MLIKVKVFPGCKKEEVVKKSEDSFEVRVKEKPQMGRANRAVVNILADYLKVSPSKIRIVKGLRRRNKLVNVL